ncbi:MAG TPA: glycosyltransferase family A protein [Anaerolineales bacterium]|nr:glycosyltransferase family A protein [Anaerolineales bacterium]
MISAIIPVRNMKDYIGRAIESLKAQVEQVDEIIVADDGSTDGTFEIAKAYGADEIIRNPNADQPWGICGGRNIAFKAAHGDFILPLDADDWVAPTYTAKTLEKMANPKVGIVSTQMMYHGQNEGRIILASKQVYWTELQANNITVTSLVRREALEQAGEWDHNLRGWEDWDMWLRILKLGWEHEVVHEPLFHYRLHTSGMNAWANAHENKQKLYGYLLSKHPGFGLVRQNGETFNGI